MLDNSVLVGVRSVAFPSSSICIPTHLITTTMPVLVLRTQLVMLSPIVLYICKIENDRDLKPPHLAVKSNHFHEIPSLRLKIIQYAGAVEYLERVMAFLIAFKLIRERGHLEVLDMWAYENEVVLDFS